MSAEYGFVPNGALLNMAHHSNGQVGYWEAALLRAKEDVARAERSLAHWMGERDAQYQALDERDIVAPDMGTHSTDPSPGFTREDGTR